MKIAINAVAASNEKRTGIEEYAYQLLKYFAKIDFENQFVLYIHKKQKNNLDFSLPANFQIKQLNAPFMWSQTRLAFELLKNKPDIFFSPSQVVPFLYVKKSIVTVHGLEYEYFPECYPMWFVQYLRYFTKYALKKACKIISVSANTKQDLIKIYKGNANKIEVIHHGVDKQNICPLTGERIFKNKYILYIGRIEIKKNIANLVRSFAILKKKYVCSHKLVLIGGKGYGWQEIYKEISHSEYKNDIILAGYIEQEEKYKILKEADVFVFPSFYEGFGIPVLEAMSVGVPVIAANNSSLIEVCGDAASLVDCNNADVLANSMYNLIADKNFRKNLIENGFKNIERFSWEECARKTLKVLYESSYCS